ncbi:hypothetical protein RG963_14425 [Methanosarcina sp. Z-7115]|uniref:Uncharacterized protein n=1 Tax=Methanosarcina baikalica TaxID=3073890 RepID=A0ABU2D4R0_9EURY|nr:hypothetical protein [Methanosarcina sp. Z-7115]MDR7666953.1 hypothetical protein [Methanosarcina sp. Z-7115]
MPLFLTFALVANSAVCGAGSGAPLLNTAGFFAFICAGAEKSDPATGLVSYRLL